jgi:hypothetical protein
MSPVVGGVTRKHPPLCVSRGSNPGASAPLRLTTPRRRRSQPGRSRASLGSSLSLVPVDDLEQLRRALLRGRPTGLRPDDGDEAFERHQLLAIRFHRAARLNGRASLGEGAEWRLYFAEHFPREDEYADLLWNEWRVALLKDETPGKGVAITHCQPHAHWKTVQPGKLLVIDLESMWGDFEKSLESFLHLLRVNPDRRRVVIDRWRRRGWTVQNVVYSQIVPDRYASVPASASVATSATASKPAGASEPNADRG